MSPSPLGNSTHPTHAVLSTANQPANAIAADATDPSDVFWVELRFPGMPTAMLLGVAYLHPHARSPTIQRLTDNIDMIRSHTSLPLLRWCKTATHPSAAARAFSDYLSVSI